MTLKVPHNLQAEEALIGAMLLKKSCIDEVYGYIKSSDFYHTGHSIIFDTIMQCYQKQASVDVVQVAEALKRDGNLDKVGGSGELIKLQAACPATTNTSKYAKIIVDHSKLRRLINIADELKSSAIYLPDDVDTFLDEAEAKIFAVAESAADFRQAATAQDSVEEVLTRFESLFKHGSTITGLPTGFTEFDQLLSGLQPGALYILGARPSAGKTAAALTAATHAAMDLNKPVAFFSLEMGKSELMQRIISSRAQISSEKIRSGNLYKEDWDKIVNIIPEISNSPLFIDDSSSLTLMELRSKLRRLKSRFPNLSLGVVDYLQLMTGGKENRQQEISEIARGLKGLSRELHMPMMALSQLSRGLENRLDKRPMLSDLRESGEIEQSADVVSFLYRDEIYNKESESKGIAELIVAKHRNGATGMIRLAFLGPYVKFGNIFNGD